MYVKASMTASESINLKGSNETVAHLPYSRLTTRK